MRQSKFEKAQSKVRSRKTKRLLDLTTKFRNELLDLETPTEVLFKGYLIKMRIRYEFQKIVFAGKSFYIVDFYLPRYCLAVEIDGRQHSEEDKMAEDQIRTDELKKVGIREIWRFTNEEVFDYQRCTTKIKKMTTPAKK